MSRKANKTMIGMFVIGSVILLVIAILLFGSGIFFKNKIDYVLFFDNSINGLSLGTPVAFRGVNVGYIKDISLIYDEKSQTMLIPVIIEVDQSRVKSVQSKGSYECKACSDYRLLVTQGLRAKLVMQSFLTGQLMIAFDFYPGTPVKLRGIMKQYPELPTLPSEGISESFENTMSGINKLVNSEGVQESFSELSGTLREVKGSARSFHLLTDYLEEHPEALLKGKSISKGE